MRLFHTSRKKLGTKVVLKPRVPSSCKRDASTFIRKFGRAENADIERICVAPSIEECLMLMPQPFLTMNDLLFRGKFKPLYVYEVCGEPKGIDTETPKTEVPDYADNKREVWLLEPNTFKKIGEIYYDLFTYHKSDMVPYLWVQLKISNPPLIVNGRGNLDFDYSFTECCNAKGFNHIQIGDELDSEASYYRLEAK
jgi:hypothetical protein